MGVGGASGSRAALHVVAGGSGSSADLGSSVGSGAAGRRSTHLEGREGSDNRDEGDGEEGLEAEHDDRFEDRTEGLLVGDDEKGILPGSYTHPIARRTELYGAIRRRSRGRSSVTGTDEIVMPPLL